MVGNWNGMGEDREGLIKEERFRRKEEEGSEE